MEHHWSRSGEVPLGAPLMDTEVEVRDELGRVVTEGEGQLFLGEQLLGKAQTNNRLMRLTDPRLCCRRRGQGVPPGWGKHRGSRDDESHWRLGEDQRPTAALSGPEGPNHQTERETSQLGPSAAG